MGIATTLTGVLSQLKETDEAIVIADNCTDDTATIARETGATVLEHVRIGTIAAKGTPSTMVCDTGNTIRWMWW